MLWPCFPPRRCLFDAHSADDEWVDVDDGREVRWKPLCPHCFNALTHMVVAAVRRGGRCTGVLQDVRGGVWCTSRRPHDTAREGCADSVGQRTQVANEKARLFSSTHKAAITCFTGATDLARNDQHRTLVHAIRTRWGVEPPHGVTAQGSAPSSCGTVAAVSSAQRCPGHTCKVP